MKLDFNFDDSSLSRLLFLGLLWGLVETLIGKWVKAWQPALFAFNMPFLIACFIIIAKHLVPVSGSILAMGIIAAVIKLFFSGMILHGAFLAILIEAALAELVFLFLPFGFWAAALVGTLLQLYSLFHPFLTKGNLCQSAHFVRFKEWLSNGLFAGKSLDNATLILILLGLHVAVGVLAGIILWPIISGQLKCCQNRL